MSYKRRGASAWFAVLVLLAAPASVQAAPTEMEILDQYLEQFDTYRGHGPVWVKTVYDRCLRTGGGEDTSKVPGVASLDATNDLMFQHAKWHGTRGFFLEPVFTYSDSDPYGTEFIEYHAELIRTYADWRALHGYPELVAWDPIAPIPPAYAYPVELPCKARTSEDPQIAVPSYLTIPGGDATSPFWGYTALCQIPDLNRLGKTIEGSWYHADVHLAIGGDMADAGLTLRDPIFWPWHTHVQQIVETWETCAPTQLAQEAGPAAKNAPGVGLLAGLALLLAARRNRSS